MLSFGPFGHVIAVWPLGFAWPSSRRAVATAPSWPLFHVSSSAFTFGSHVSTVSA